MRTGNEDPAKQSGGSKSLQFTVQRDQAREALGVTPKQLRTWQEEGLFSPQLGKGSQRFTESDVSRLRFLHSLILEIGLPISTVKELYAPFYHGPASLQEQKSYREKGLEALPSDPSDVFIFLDLQSKRLADHSSAFRAVRDAMVVDRNQGKLIHIRLMTLMAIRTSDFRGGNPTVYAATLEALFDQLRMVAQAARVGSRYSPDGQEYLDFDPRLPDDPDLSQEELQDLRDQHKRRMGKYYADPF